MWDRGRNWTTVVVEVVCADVWSSEHEVPDPGSGLPLREKAGLEEDEDVLEIPMFVRMEWDADEGGGGGGGGDGGDAIADNTGGVGGGSPGGPPTTKASVKRELAFWVVVGLGRVGGIPSKAGLDR